MKKIILSKKEIEKSCKTIGKKLTKDLKDEKKIPIVVGIMKGSLNFMMDLVKYIDTNFYMDFIQVSSYSGTRSTGVVTLKRNLSFDIKDRTIVLIEDVVDTGISMDFLLKFIKNAFQPKRIILVALFDKKFRREKEVKIDYVGKVLNGDDFLIGYGLDYNELGRNWPDVYSISKEDINLLNKKIYEDK